MAGGGAWRGVTVPRWLAWSACAGNRDSLNYLHAAATDRGLQCAAGCLEGMVYHCCCGSAALAVAAALARTGDGARSLVTNHPSRHLRPHYHDHYSADCHLAHRRCALLVTRHLYWTGVGKKKGRLLETHCLLGACAGGAMLLELALELGLG